MLASVCVYTPFSPAAETNFVFAVQNGLQGAVLEADMGGRPSLRLLNSREIESLLVGNSANTILALAVSDLQCDPLGPRPTVKLVSYDRVQGQILRTLAAFDDPQAVYVRQDSIVIHSTGETGDGLVSQDLEALINFRYTPCLPPNATTTPVFVDVSPLGTVKPPGRRPAFAPLMPDAGTLQIASNDPDSPLIVVDLSGTGAATALCNITVSPASLNFGEVLVGTNQTLTLNIRNIGTTSCPVNTITLTGSSDFMVVSAPSTPTTVASGASLAVVVRYTPGSAGGDSATLRIASGDGAEPVISVSVSGTGATEPTPLCDISVSPSPLSFGQVAVGSSSNVTMVITNSGNISCTVNSITLTGGAGFELVGLPVLPLDIVAGDSASVEVRYSPPSTGNNSGILRVTSTDPAEPVILVPVSGSGVAASRCAIMVDSTSLNFGSVEVGTNKTLIVNVSNTGSAECTVDFMTIVAGASSNNFALVSPPTPFTVATNESVEVEIAYTPTLTSTNTASLQIVTDDFSIPPVVVSLRGIGVAPECHVEVESIDVNFGVVAVGTSVTNTVASIASVGLTNCTINSVTLASTNEFALVNVPATPFTVEPGMPVDIEVEYTPLDSGADSVSLQIESDDPAGTQTVVLSARAVMPTTGCGLNADPDDVLDFGDVSLGTTKTLRVVLSNTGDEDCTVSTIALTNAPAFTLIGAPATPFFLSPEDRVALAVRYTPSGTNDDVGVLRIISNHGDPDQRVLEIDLQGTGAQCNIDIGPLELDFGAIEINSTNELNVIVANMGVVNCTVNSISLLGSGDFSLDETVPRNQFLLAPGSAIMIPVRYRPSNVGEDSGTLRVVVANTSHDVSLTGTGLTCAIEVIPLSLDFGVVTVGTTNSLSTTVRNVGSVNCSVDLAVVGNLAFTVTPPLTFTLGTNTESEVEIKYAPEDVQTILILGGTVRTSGRILKTVVE